MSYRIVGDGTQKVPKPPINETFEENFRVPMKTKMLKESLEKYLEILENPLQVFVETSP